MKETQQQSQAKKQVLRIVSQKAYTQEKFYTNKEQVSKLINLVNMSQPNCKNVYKVIRIMIRFFGFPVLILLAQLYKKVQKNTQYMVQFDQQLKAIANYVKKMIKNLSFPCLDFYLASGFNPKIVAQLPVTQTQDAIIFMSQIQPIDKLAGKIVKDQQKTILKEIDMQIQAIMILKQDKRQAIEDLCLDKYMHILGFKKKQILKNLGNYQRQQIKNLQSRVIHTSASYLREKQQRKNPQRSKQVKKSQSRISQSRQSQRKQSQSNASQPRQTYSRDSYIRASSQIQKQKIASNAMIKQINTNTLIQVKNTQKQQIGIKTMRKKIEVGQGSTIEVLRGNQTVKVTDIKAKKDHLCCRTSFYQNQIIQQAQSQVQQYKNYGFPYSKTLQQILMKTIVGFLNKRGGIIYIGIKQNTTTFQRTVVGAHYSQATKQQVLKRIRQLCQRIAPDIVNNPRYRVEFVPIKNSSGSFVPGFYILRLRIQKGYNQDLYSYKNFDDNQYFAFRTPNQVLVKKFGQQILQIYRQKLLNLKIQPDFIMHEGPCKPPQLGKVSYDPRTTSSYQSSNTNMKKPMLIMPQSKKQAKILYKQKNAIMTFYYCKAAFLLPQLSTYKLDKYEDWSAVQAYTKEDLMKIQDLVKLSKHKDMYKRASNVIQFDEQMQFPIKKLLDNNKILHSFQSRMSVAFSSIKETLEGLKYLNQCSIAYGFKQPF